jgi:hypothetical protein
MIELGAVIGNIVKKIKDVTEDWLGDQVAVYNKLHDYNVNKTALFPNDPIGLKCFTPTEMSTVFPAHGGTSVCEFVDDDTIIFYAGAPASGQILNTYTISTQEFSDDITPDSSFSCYRKSGVRRRERFYKTSFGYAWVDADQGVQYTADNFVTISSISPYAFSGNMYMLLSTYQDGDNIVLTYLVPYESYETRYIVDVTYDTSAGTSSIGTETPYCFSLIGRGIKRDSFPYMPVNFVNKIGEYILFYNSYGYRTGLFFVDITGVDQYWYYVDLVLLTIFSRDVPGSFVHQTGSTGRMSGIVGIKKILNSFYFVFATERTLPSNNYKYTINDRFVLCKMETV